MARRPRPYSEEDFADVQDGRASKSEQKRHVQRMAALAEQLAELPKKQIQKLPVDKRLIDAFLELESISSFEARRRQFQRIGKLLRTEDETMLLSFLVPKQGAKKQAQLLRWVDRVIEQGDIAINEFCKLYQAADRHTLRQHVLRYQRDAQKQIDEPDLAKLRQNIINYVQQVALISE
ncbi:ribosome biogenesis factor YjgA [Acinetobacter puyangensis]|uniref:Ribosome-associated protein n=1 Tax=Acinetobacter puyangensis TaxID=1096779 RepID=A0A240EER3_9GAMM|nr:ribosome biogenesis factor YjgA [Acinetobacter puyangensis]SNX46455.1 ribosome-associated protein [Acinetobacter puyangensis]